MGKSSGSSERPVTAEERALWDSQSENLEMMTKIAEDQYNIGQEDREYYENVFREGSDTEAKQAIAELKSKITGTEVSAEEIESVDIDSLLRDTILNSTPEFQKAATELVTNSQQLTAKYGTSVTGISDTFSKSIGNLNTNYQAELQSIKEATGTINQDVLAREVGAASAGISSSYAEARKQMSGDLAKRGLSGSGVEAQLLASTYNQEAMNKASASSTARASALQQSEAIRQQQASIAGSQLQAGTSTAGTQYQTDLGAVQNIYGVTTASDMQNYQTSQAATLQGIAGLTQVAQAGQGLYAGAANYLSSAASTSGQAAQIAGNSASSLGQLNESYSARISAENAAGAAGIGSLVGTLGAAALTGGVGTALGSMMAPAAFKKAPGSDFRFKNNIKLHSIVKGIKFYTWEWNEFAKDYLGDKELYEPFGVIAQELIEIHPELVSNDENGYMFVDYTGLDKLIKDK
jgi:hypothetical protein